MEGIRFAVLVADPVSRIPNHRQFDAVARVVLWRFLARERSRDPSRPNWRRAEGGIDLDTSGRGARSYGVESRFQFLHLRLQLLNLLVHVSYRVALAFVRRLVCVT